MRLSSYNLFGPPSGTNERSISLDMGLQTQQTPHNPQGAPPECEEIATLFDHQPNYNYLGSFGKIQLNWSNMAENRKLRLPISQPILIILDYRLGIYHSTANTTEWDTLGLLPYLSGQTIFLSSQSRQDQEVATKNINTS